MQEALHGGRDDTHAAVMREAKFSWVVQNVINAQWAILAFWGNFLLKWKWAIYTINTGTGGNLRSLLGYA